MLRVASNGISKPVSGQLAQTPPRLFLKAEVGGDQREAWQPRFLVRLLINETFDNGRHLG